MILKRKRETWQMVILAYQARVFIYLSLVHKALCFFHRWSMSSDNLTKSWFTGVSAKAVGKLFRMTRILFFLVWRAPWVVLESTRLLRLSEDNPKGKWIEIHLFLKIFGRQHFSETKVASGNWTFPRKEGQNPPLKADVVRAGFQAWYHSLSFRAPQSQSPRTHFTRAQIRPHWPKWCHQNSEPTLWEVACPSPKGVVEQRVPHLSFPGLSPLLHTDVGFKYCCLEFPSWLSGNKPD